MGRTPHGVRELKLRNSHQPIQDQSRTPHGVRELKHNLNNQELPAYGSRTPHGVRELKLIG